MKFAKVQILNHKNNTCLQKLLKSAPPLVFIIIKFIIY